MKWEAHGIFPCRPMSSYEIPVVALTQSSNPHYLPQSRIFQRKMFQSTNAMMASKAAEEAEVRASFMISWFHRL